MYKNNSVRIALLLATLVSLHESSKAANSWTSTGSMTVVRNAHTSTLLPNGKILVAGSGGAAGGNNAEIYDPSTGVWSSAGNMNSSRYQHIALLLLNGKVLLAGGGVATAEIFDPATGIFALTGSMSTDRVEFTATLLPNGTVLVAGGVGASPTAASSAEIYDPATGTWSITGSMNTAHANHTGTLLPNGKVLVTGGYTGPTGTIAAAELYDPSTGVWTSINSMNQIRNLHTATLLPNGKVLVSGGSNGTVGLATAEIYDPNLGTWTLTGSLGALHAQHVSALLPNGKVLVAGGSNTTDIATTEIYDPTAGTWSTVGSMSTARESFAATVLVSGQVLVAGGYSNGADVASAEIFDPSSGGSWSTTGSMAAARGSLPTATLLPNGQVLAAGGYLGAELFDPTTSTWSAAGSFGTARGGHTATLLASEKVLVAGGFDGTNYLSSAMLYDPAANIWSITGSLASARDEYTATLLPSGKVLAVGGLNGVDLTGGGAELYDAATNTWSAAANPVTGRFRHTATLLSSGKVLIAGGQNGGGYVSTAELYDPAANTWSAAGSLTTARYNHTATLLPSGKVLVTGGVNSVYLATAELYDPAGNTWSAAGSLATARASHAATLLPNGKVLASGGYNGSYLASTEVYDPVTNGWSAAGSLTTARYGPRATLLPNGNVLVVGGNNSGGNLASAELYNPGLQYQSAWQPVISTTNSPVSVNGALVLTGSGFNGISEASGGSTNNSASNYPIVQLHSLVNDQTEFLLPDPAHPFSASGFTSQALSGFPAGYALVTVFTNGIPSNSIMISIIPNPVSTISLQSGSGQSTLVNTAFGASLAAIVKDVNGNAVPGVSVTFAAPASGTSGTFSLSATVTTDSSGLATAPVFTANTISGNYTVTATVAGIATPASFAATNLPGPATVLAVSGVPASIVAGTANSFTVTAQDSFGNVASAYTGTVQFKSSDANAVLPPNYTFVAADNGIHTFNATLKTVGTQTLTVTDTVTASITGTQSGINVNPGSASALVVSGFLSPGTAGVSGGFIVTANDSFGNTATGYTGTVHFTCMDGAATLPPDYTFAAADNGAKTFSVTFKTAGTQSLTATDTVNASITGIQSGITINPYAPVITSSLSANAVVGTAFSYTITAANSPASFNATPLPAGLSVDTTKGIISGTPTVSGTFSVTISATNVTGTGSATLSLTIAGQAPAITSVLNANGVVGQPFSYTITASGASPITFSAQPLPNGLSLSGVTLSGTPVTAGTTSVALGASNSFGSDNSKTLILTINPAGSASITSALTASGSVGTAFSYTVTVSGTAPVTITTGTLPSWLTFTASSAALSGTPPASATGTLNVSLSASNSIGTDNEMLVITINASGSPSITSALTVSATAAQRFTYTITASSSGNATITFGATPLPAWLTLSGVTLSGTPAATDVGNLTITLTATNTSGTDTKQLSVTVVPASGQPPVITDISLSRNPVRTNTDVSFTATADSLSGLPLNYTWYFFLNGQADGNAISGNPVSRQFSSEGQYDAVAVASDGFETSAEFKTLTVTLAPNLGAEGVPSVLDTTAVQNPTGNLAITIPESSGGVLDVDVGTGSSRGVSGETFETAFNGISNVIQQPNLAGKFTKPGIYIVNTVGKDPLGNVTRFVRRMLPVAAREVGPEVSVVDPSNRSIFNTLMKGKFTFGNKPDTVALSGAITLPAGMDLSQPQQMSIGVGNLVEDVTVSNKGRAGATGRLKSFQIAYPHLKKGGPPLTGTGIQAKFKLTLSGLALDKDAFDSEGITNAATVALAGDPRSIQVALVLGGTSYYVYANALYSVKKNQGSLSSK